MLPPIPDDEAALLRGVCLDPWDDLPRLVIADWYEEHGEAIRAEMIRTQCAASRERTAEAWSLAAAVMARFVEKYNDGLPEPNVYGEHAARLGLHLRGWWEDIEFDRWAQYKAATRDGLWARAPVVRVDWRGRRIRQDATNSLFVWRRSGGGDDYVPPRVFDRMVRLASPRPARVANRHAWYASWFEAREALARACVDEGRAFVHFPLLAWPAFVEPPDEPR